MKRTVHDIRKSKGELPMKNKGKLKIILITFGAIAVCTAALIGGIAIAGNVEENKIIKTDYSDEGEKQQDSNDALTKDNSVSVSQSGAAQSGENSEKALENNQDLNTKDGISIDEAKGSYQSMYSLFFGSEMPAKHISASLHSNINAWLLGNKEAVAYVDSQTGEVTAFYNIRGYIGETVFSEDEFASYKESLTKDHDKYIEKATSFIEKNFADGRNISEVVFDGVVFTGEPGKKGTFRLTLRVLMESGSSYCITYTEGPYNLDRFFSYESADKCLSGSSFENRPPTVYDHHIYSPEIVYDSQIGPEHLTVDEAMDLAIEYCETITGKTLEKPLISARFRISGSAQRALWYIYDDYFSISFDAITGNLIDFTHGNADEFDTNDPMPKPYIIENDEDDYFAMAKEVLGKYLKNSGKVDYMMIDGIQVIFDDYNNPVSYLVDCHVIMETGPCYTISFAGSDKILWRIYSFDSEADLFGI